MIFRGGCIIRGQSLHKIKESYDKNPCLSNLLLDSYFNAIIDNYQIDWRKVISTAVIHVIAVPDLSSALCYFDSYRSSELPANLLQAQRDYIGAHTYELIDKPQGEFYHTNRTGHGGKTSASTYIV